MFDDKFFSYQVPKSEIFKLSSVTSVGKSTVNTDINTMITQTYDVHKHYNGIVNRRYTFVGCHDFD